MNSSKNWELQIDPSVFKTLKKIPSNYGRRIIHIIERLGDDPYAGDIQKMKGEENSWRRRVGDYRIFFKIKVPERVILVFHAERRTSKTY